MNHETVGGNERSDISNDLSVACSEFLEAGRKYRKFLKSKYPDRLHGVIWVQSEDGELVLYTESERYAVAIKRIAL